VRWNLLRDLPSAILLTLLLTFVLTQGMVWVFAAGTVSLQDQGPVSVLMINPLSGDNNFDLSSAEYPVNSNFTVEFYITEVTNLSAWQIYVSWNNSIINFAAPWVPEQNVFQEAINNGATPLVAQDLEINTTSNVGYFQYGMTTLYTQDVSGTYPVNVTGQGLLCSINFTVAVAPEEGEDLTTNLEMIEQTPEAPPGYFMSFILLCEDGTVTSPIGVSAQPASITIYGPTPTIYIRAAGNVDPETAPITRNGDTYTFAGNISNVITVERDDIVLNGAGYTLQGTANETGISLTSVSNVTINNLQITGFGIGILLNSSNTVTISGNNITNNDGGVSLFNSSDNSLFLNNLSNNEYGAMLDSSSCNNTICENNIAGNGQWGVGLWSQSDCNSLLQNTIADNGYGIWLWYSSDNNTISRNSIAANGEGGIWLWTSSSYNVIVANNITANNWYGIGLWSQCNCNSLLQNTIADNGYGIEFWDQSSNNAVYHNNFVANQKQVQIFNSSNLFDDGYPSGGNYWSDYVGNDSYSGPGQNITGSDGIGDTPYVIGGGNVDHYPLMAEFLAFSTSSGYDMDAISNSTILDFQYFSNNSTITMQVSNATNDQTYGFCRLEIPRSVLVPPYTVTVSNSPVQYATLFQNESFSLIYFTYQQTTEEITIQEQDITPPTILILQPENKTYSVNSTSLTFTVDKPTSWIGYSLDGQANVTINGNTTLADIQDGFHEIILYANSTAGIMGQSNITWFAVDTTPPTITDVYQDPPSNDVLPVDTVSINVTVTDAVSGVKQVILSYTANNETWFSVNATNLGQNIFNAVIPPFPSGTNVTYIVTAVDNVNNTISTRQMGYEYQYRVVPELPTMLILLLMMTSTLFATVVYKRTRERQIKKHRLVLIRAERKRLAQLLAA
jgi:parallel beta-helix repeat protein